MVYFGNLPRGGTQAVTVNYTFRCLVKKKSLLVSNHLAFHIKNYQVRIRGRRKECHPSKGSPPSRIFFFTKYRRGLKSCQAQRGSQIFLETCRLLRVLLSTVASSIISLEFHVHSRGSDREGHLPLPPLKQSFLWRHVSLPPSFLTE